jgi:hypothetical protein
MPIGALLRNRWTYAAFLALLLIVVGGTAVWRLDALRDRPTPAPHPPVTGEGSFDRFRLEGFRHTSYHLGQKVFSVEAGEIVHRRRRVGPLAVNPLKELVLSDVRIELNPLPEGSGPGAEPSVRSGVENMLLQEKLGMVSRVLFHELVLSSSRDGTFRFRVRAREASVDLAARSVTFPGPFLLESAAGDRLEAEDVQWRDDQETFHVRGAFLLHQANGVTPGRDTYFVVEESGKVVR